MNKVKLDFGLKKRSRVAIGVCVATIAVIILAALVGLSHDIRTSIEDSVKMTIINVTEQSAKVVYKDIISKQEFLQALAQNITDEYYKDEDACLHRISILAKAYGMDQIGVLTPDGMCHMENNKIIDLRTADYLSQVFSGQPIITKSFLYGDESEEYVNVFAIPVEVDNHIPFVLIATYLSDDFSESLKTDSFGGIGKSVVVDSEGRAVVTTSDSNQNSNDSIVTYIYENPEIAANQGNGNFFKFSYDGETYLSCMKEIGINDWYVLTYVDKTTVFQEANLIQKSVLSVSAVLLFIIVTTLTILILILSRYKKNVHRFVFVDEVLKEHNYEYLKALYETLSDAQKENLFLAVMDIDGFKALNMSYGNDMGDEILRYIGQAFKESCPDDEIYRRYSDHFAALMQGESQDIIEKKLDLLLHTIQTDIELKRVIPFTLSIGVSRLDGVQHLYSGYTKAMLAKSSIKGNYLNQYAFFEDYLRQVSVRNMELCSAFDQALRNKEFRVVYQPKYDMRTRDIVGAEALVRWVKPDGNVIFPGEFIPCFEDSSQIIQLDEYVFQTVCEQMIEMEQKELPVKRVSINLSRVHIKSRIIIERIYEIISKYEIDPQKIAIELTESAVCDDSESVCNLVNGLHGLGFRVDMDDYGTGISSLLSLANADFDVIKLDKSFVSSIGNQKMEAVIKSTIELAKQLHLGVVAEGIETKEQQEFLVHNGCHCAQGYYYSKPISKEEYEVLLEQSVGFPRT